MSDPKVKPSIAARELNYRIGEVLYWLCSKLWQVSRVADKWRGQTAHTAAVLQEEYLRAKHLKKG